MRVWSRGTSVLAQEHVTHAADRLEVAGSFGIGLELGAQLGDVYVDRSIESLVSRAFQRVEQLLAREHTPRRTGERGEQVEFVGRQRQARAAYGHLACREIDLESAGAEARRGHQPVRPEKADVFSGSQSGRRQGRGVALLDDAVR